MTPAEHKRLIEICVEEAKGKVPVIAGAGSNNTAEAIEYAAHARKAGADAALIVVPYYKQATQEGIYQHYRAIAKAVDIPSLSTMFRAAPSPIAQSRPSTAWPRICPNIVGTKDASADLTRPSRQRLMTGEKFIQLSGEDGTALGFNAHGRRGLYFGDRKRRPSALRGDAGSHAQRRLQEGDFHPGSLMPLHHALFVETNPGPIKLQSVCLATARRKHACRWCLSRSRPRRWSAAPWCTRGS